MHIRVIWTGKTKDARLKALIDDYLQRLSHFARCEVLELKESKTRAGKAGIERDSKRISDRLPRGGLSVLLDPEGAEWSSQQLADRIREWENRGTKELAFIVGGPEGVSNDFMPLPDQRWSLSRLTLTHEMARVVMLEQLYRAYTIIRGLPYQK